MEGTMLSSSSALHLKVKKALFVVAMLALYAAIRKGIYEDEDEEEMGVLLCAVVVGIARASGRYPSGCGRTAGHCRTRSVLIGVLEHLSSVRILCWY